MKPLKHLYLYFQDGQRLALRFPKQSEDPAAVARALRKQLESPFLSIEVDGDLLEGEGSAGRHLKISRDTAGSVFSISCSFIRPTQ